MFKTKAKNSVPLAVCLLASLCLAGCAGAGADSAAPSGSLSSQVASGSETASIQNVTEPGMTPIYGESLVDGSYAITVDSSSSMFRVIGCTLTVEKGAMTAQMTMGGTGYLYLYPGTGESAAAAPESDYIPYSESPDGVHTFIFPVEALDQGIPCAAFSKNKEKWYDRTLVFRADSLPLEAFAPGLVPTAESLGLADGSYQVEAALSGGSGKAGVDSPARLTVEDGQAWVTLVWSSGNYDYMKVDGARYDAQLVDGRSVFVIPALCFDLGMPVAADTVAMSVPHEIDYTLRLDSASITPEGTP